MANMFMDARLHILLAVGVPVLGWMFSRCWSYDNNRFYDAGGMYYPFCVEFDDVSVLGVVPLKWTIAVAVCVLILSVYRLWSGQNSK